MSVAHNNEKVQEELSKIKFDEMSDDQVKDTLHDFAQKAKRVVTDTVHAQTLAYEQEQKLLEGMRTKNNNMLRALAAID